MTCDSYKAAWVGHTFKKIRGSWFQPKEKQYEMFPVEDMGPPRVTKKLPRNEPKTRKDLKVTKY